PPHDRTRTAREMTSLHPANGGWGIHLDHLPLSARYGPNGHALRHQPPLRSILRAEGDVTRRRHCPVVPTPTDLLTLVPKLVPEFCVRFPPYLEPVAEVHPFRLLPGLFRHVDLVMLASSGIEDGARLVAVQGRTNVPRRVLDRHDVGHLAIEIDCDQLPI